MTFLSYTKMVQKKQQNSFILNKITKVNSIHNLLINRDNLNYDVTIIIYNIIFVTLKTCKLRFSLL
jgi:hypothetical protein